MNFFYTPFLQHHHFIWDFEQKVIIGRKNAFNSSVCRNLDCSIKNFPLKCFYNEGEGEILLFYRQGESFRIEDENIEKYEFQDIYDADLG